VKHNLDWLVARGYRYLVVRRGGERQFETAEAVSIKTASGEPLSLQKTFSEDGKEVLLYCHSPGREAKETAMVKGFCQDFVAGLKKIDTGLAQITLETDEAGKIATALHWEKTAL